MERPPQVRVDCYYCRDSGMSPEAPARCHCAEWQARFEKSLPGDNQPLPTDPAVHLGNLLAVIHCDGGHWQDYHGTDKAVADALLAALYPETPNADTP